MWSQQEDTILKDIVEGLEHRKWAEVAQILHQRFDVYKRTGKQCRERWVNYLDPSIKSEGWTPGEEQRLFDFQSKFGNKWSVIAKELEGRPDNCVKNHFYSALRKGLRKINTYIQARFRRSEARPVSSHFLSKVLLLADGDEGVRQPKKPIQEKCVAIKKELIYYSQEVPINEESDDRLDRLVQLILEVNRIYRNKKRRRKGNKVPHNGPSNFAQVSKVEHQSDESPSNEVEIPEPQPPLLPTSPSLTDSSLKPAPLLMPQPYQSLYGGGVMWMITPEQERQLRQFYAYQQYASPLFGHQMMGYSPY